ncbi:MAG: hypothetical protein SCK70_18045, partial [bacterium]|nr:hypothetical protein [bacterium]
QFRWQKRRLERSNQTLTAQEGQSDVFVNFIRSGFLNSGFRGRFFPEEMLTLKTDYHIFPNYYTFVNHFKSDRWPIFNMALESFLNQRTETTTGGFRRFFTGLNEEEKANIALMEQNLAEVLNDPDQKDIVVDVMKLKGKYLFQLIESKIPEGEFDQFLFEFIRDNRLEDVDVDVFVNRLINQTNFDLTNFFDNWYQSHELPGFLVADIQAYKILDADRTRFQVRFKAQNSESVEGLLSVSFRMGGRRFGFGGGGPDEVPEQIFSFAPGEIKEIGIVLDDEPRMLLINTLVAKNLPNEISYRFDDLELNEKAVAFEGERLVDTPVRLTLPGEIIVDNE